MLTPLPGATDLKPGSATQPFFGVEPILLDTEGNEIEGAGEGLLMIKSSWPSQIRTVYGDHQRCIDTYFSAYPGYYFTGDGARRDKDGDYWITGRVDDVLNVSGHRMGTAEVESALVLHEQIAEAAVVGYPHAIKGQGIYCYVTPMSGVVRLMILCKQSWLLFVCLKSDRSPSPISFNGRRDCRKRAQARLCDESCVKLPPMSSITWVIRLRWLTRRWSMSSLRIT